MPPKIKGIREQKREQKLRAADARLRRKRNKHHYTYVALLFADGFCRRRFIRYSFVFIYFFFPPGARRSRAINEILARKLSFAGSFPRRRRGRNGAERAPKIRFARHIMRQFESCWPSCTIKRQINGILCCVFKYI